MTKTMFWCALLSSTKIANAYSIDSLYVFSGFLFCKKLFILPLLNLVLGLMRCVIGVDAER